MTPSGRQKVSRGRMRVGGGVDTHTQAQPYQVAIDEREDHHPLYSLSTQIWRRLESMGNISQNNAGLAAATVLDIEPRVAGELLARAGYHRRIRRVEAFDMSARAKFDIDFWLGGVG